MILRTIWTILTQYALKKKKKKLPRRHHVTKTNSLGIKLLFPNKYGFRTILKCTRETPKISLVYLLISMDCAEILTNEFFPDGGDNIGVGMKFNKHFENVDRPNLCKLF